MSGKSAQVSGTPNHPFWCVDRHAWIKMGDLEVGAVLDGVRGDIKVVGREVAFARVPVFNFEVDTLHSYRVTELGVLVHNYDIKTRGSPGGDGGLSQHLIKRDEMGNATSVTHRVTVDGVVVHQHETHLGKHGGARRFPDEWTGTETINAGGN